MKEKNLKDNILKIIIFYNIFEYPLTLIEIQKNVGLEYSLLEISNALAILVNEGVIENKNGFYFLTSSAEIINTRLKRYNYSKRKENIAKRFSSVFAIFPFTRAVYLVNSMGLYNLRDGSDIDFLIIARQKRIWLTRLYCAGIAKILNKRPNAKTKKDKICLSFYLSDNSLNFSDFKLKTGDPYFDYWEKNLLLLIDKNNIHHELLKKNNLLSNYLIDDNDTKESVKKNNSFLVDKIEKASSVLQYKIMPKKLLLASEINNESGVSLSANVIKLYLKDKRLEIKEKYEQELKNYN